MRASPLPRMTSAEFVDWAMRQPSGRYELVDGEVVAMSPERSGHNRVKGNVFVALRAAIKAAGLPCQATRTEWRSRSTTGTPTSRTP